MLGFFRRFTNSRVGAIIAFVVLGLIAFAFAAGDVTGLSSGSGGMTAKTAAEVGGDTITEVQLVSAAKDTLRSIQERQPTANMAGLLAQNGVERLLEQLIDRSAATEFAAAQGMVVSDRAVDGVIASVPAFRGADGKFSPAAFQAVLQQQRIPEGKVRSDIASERLIQFLTAPANGAARVSRQFALPYASLLLERRKGAVALLPITAVGLGAPPSDADLAAYYTANRARYIVPERRVIRYAAITPAGVLAAATPTDAELQAAYRTDSARFAASERRSAQVVVVLDQAAAARLAATARGGTGLDAAGRALGLEARILTKLDKPGIVAQTSAGLADALFAASPDAIVGPVRGGGGFTVAKLTAVDRIAAKTFAEARADLLPEVTKANQSARLVKLNDALDTAASEGATFDEMVRAQQLTARQTPAVLPNGVNPLQPAIPADPALGPVVQGGFAAELGDAPQIVPLGTDGGFALVALAGIQPAAPRPLADVRADVARAIQLQRAQAAVRAVAAGVVARVNGGMPLNAALAATGLKLPPARPVDVPRAAIASDPRGGDPALVLMFAMAAGRAKLLELPGGGWAVVALDTITRGDAGRDQRTLAAAQGDLNRVVGRELIQQFGRAMRDKVGVKRNPTAVSRARAELSGQVPGAQP